MHIHTLIFIGVAFAQIILMIYQYYFFRRKEYISYILYIFFFSSCVVLNVFPEFNPFPEFQTTEQPFTPNRGLFLISFAMYYRFGRFFTDTPQLNPRLNILIYIAEYLLLFFGTIDIFALWVGVPYPVFESYFVFIYLFTIGFSFFLILYYLSLRRLLTSILVIGSGILVTFGLIEFIDMQWISENKMPQAYYMAYMEMGFIGEILCLNFGLLYKSRMVEMSKNQLELRNRLQVFQQRMQISRDLHDEVGSTLSGIILLCQFLRQKLEHVSDFGHMQLLRQMETESRDMINKLKEIIWVVHPECDSIENLLHKLDEYAKELAQVKNIVVRTHLPDNFQNIRIDMESRRNIYLLCKEAINNAIKYSECQLLTLLAQVENRSLFIRIADDGKGFDISSVKRGNGLVNMERRAKNCGGSLTVDSMVGNGTAINLSIASTNGLGRSPENEC